MQYPIIIEKTEDSSRVAYLVTIPDFYAYTQGRTVEEAKRAAKDLVEMLVYDMQEDGEALPMPGGVSGPSYISSDAILTSVVVEFSKYN